MKLANMRARKEHKGMGKNITSRNKRLKAFLVSYVLNTQKDDLKSVEVTAFTKEEAGDIFIKWAKGKKLYKRITGVIVQPIKMTKRNAYYFTKQFYERQNSFVNSLGKVDA